MRPSKCAFERDELADVTFAPRKFDIYVAPTTLTSAFGQPEYFENKNTARAEYLFSSSDGKHDFSLSCSVSYVPPTNLYQQWRKDEMPQKFGVYTYARDLRPIVQYINVHIGDSVRIEFTDIKSHWIRQNGRLERK